MNDKATISLVESDVSSEHLLADIEISDAGLLGKPATFEVILRVDVKDRRGINEETTLFQEPLTVSHSSVQVQIPKSRIRAYTYRGAQIDLQVLTRLKVDDALIFDTTITSRQELALGIKSKLTTNAAAIIDPKDQFSFARNMRAIPVKNQMLSLGLLVVGFVVAIVNVLIGVHDQMVPEAAGYFYNHYNSDGESQSPLVSALIGSGALGAGVWYLIRRQLRSYMTFTLSSLPKRVRYGDVLKAGDLFAGRSRVLLENVRLRIVACNMEKGQYKRGSGTNERTVSFSEPSQAVVLYERNVSQIPMDTPIESYFKQRFSFDVMFESLYPPLTLSSSHGLSVHWEIQLIHPLFVDHELLGPTALFVFEDFVR